MKIGLESDFELINVSIKDHEKFINSQNIIVNWMDGKYEYNDSLTHHFKYTFWTTIFLPKDAPFESLKQFGMRNIMNKQLRDQISHLYDVVYEETMFWQNEYKKTSIDYRSTLAEIGFDIKGSDVSSSYIQPIDPSTLQTNKAYLFNLKMTNGTLEVFTNSIMKNAKKEMEKTIKMIEQELTKG